MTMQLGVARLIDDAFALFTRANTQVAKGNPTTAGHLLGRATRTIEQAQVAAHPALGYGIGAQRIMEAARVRGEAAHALLAVGDVRQPTALTNSAKFALDILRPG